MLLTPQTAPVVHKPDSDSEMVVDADSFRREPQERNRQSIQLIGQMLSIRRCRTIREGLQFRNGSIYCRLLGQSSGERLEGGEIQPCTAPAHPSIIRSFDCCLGELTHESLHLLGPPTGERLDGGGGGGEGEIHAPVHPISNQRTVRSLYSAFSSVAALIVYRMYNNT